jgi:S-adenosylmethionine:tRNA-ribosyltransferase-isomerase (queuine synthetase)
MVFQPQAKNTKHQLGSIQRTARLVITGAMKSTHTAVIQMLLHLTSLDLLIMANAKVALHRLHTLKQPDVSDAETGLLSVW